MQCSAVGTWAVHWIAAAHGALGFTIGGQPGPAQPYRHAALASFHTARPGLISNPEGVPALKSIVLMSTLSSITRRVDIETTDFRTGAPSVFDIS